MSPFSSSSQEFPVGLKFRPTDTTFYDLFTEAANHLVTGSALLAEMLSETSTTNSWRSPCARPSTRPTRPRTRSSAA